MQTYSLHCYNAIFTQFFEPYVSWCMKWRNQQPLHEVFVGLKQVMFSQRFYFNSKISKTIPFSHLQTLSKRRICTPMHSCCVNLFPRVEHISGHRINDHKHSFLTWRYVTTWLTLTYLFIICLQSFDKCQWKTNSLK